MVNIIAGYLQEMILLLSFLYVIVHAKKYYVANKDNKDCERKKLKCYSNTRFSVH